MNSFVRFIVNNNLGDVYDIMYNPKILNGKYCSCNTSCAWFKDDLILNSRLVDYKKIYQSDNFYFIDSNRTSQSYIFTKQGFNSRNIISKFKDNKVSDVREVKYPKSIVPNVRYKGLEDCRLVVWDNKLYAYGTRWDRVKDKGCICIYEIDDNGIPSNEIVVYPQSSNNCEKNWGAIEDQPFTFVYSNNPTTVVKVGMNGSCNLISQSEKNDDINLWVKGSTQVIRYSDDEYMALVHSNDMYTVGQTEYSDYLTAFIFYDNNFNVTRMSKWFVFNSPMCEFTCGLAKHNDDIYITYSQLDCTSRLIVTNKNAIEKFLIQDDDSISNDMFYDYYNLAKKYESNNQITSAYVLFNYAAQMLYKSEHYISDELELECLIKTFCGIVETAPDFLVHKIYNDIYNSLKRVIEQYPETPEFYYMLCAVCKIGGNRQDEYLYYKQLGDNYKVKLHNYFFKYLNPNYL